MSKKRTIHELIDALTLLRETFGIQLREIQNEYEATVKQNKIDFKPGTERYKNEMAQAEKKYKDACEALRNGCKEVYEPIFAELEMDAQVKASVINQKMIDELRVFETLPLSTEEFDAIAYNYGNKNYYADRLLEKIAEQNGIRPHFQKLGGIEGIEPNLKIKLSILRDLKARADRFVNNFGTRDGNNPETRQALFPGLLLDAERRYGNGFQEHEMTPRQIASRVAENMRTNPGNASYLLDNALENATPSVKNAIYNEMLTAEDSAIKGAVKRCKSRDKIAAFDVGGYEMAEKAFLSLGKEGIDAQEVFRTNSGNVFFNDMAKEFKQGEAVTWETVPTESAAAEVSI